MTWKQALEETLDQWYALRDEIGLAPDVELLTDIHAACPLCEKATEVAGDPARRCEVCPLSRQFGSCYPISGEMSESIARHDFAGLADLVDEFIARLEAVRLPFEAEPDPSLVCYVELL